MNDYPWEKAGSIERYRGYLLLLANLNPQPRLRGKVDPSDIVQMTLLHAFDKREQFRGRTEAEFLGWLRAIMANHLAEAARKFSRHRRNASREQSLQAALGESDSRIATCLEASGSSPSQRIIRGEEILALVDALGQLPSDQRRAVELHHLQKYSLADTATEMSRTREAVAGLLYRGLQKLREQLAPLSEN